MNFLQKFYKNESLTNRRTAYGPFLAAALLLAVLALTSYFYTNALGRKNLVLGEANIAYDNFLKGADLLADSEVNSAARYFQDAADSFSNLEQELSLLSDAIKPLDESNLQTGLALARAGGSLSFAGELLAGGIAGIVELPLAFVNLSTLNSSRGGDDLSTGDNSANLRSVIGHSLNQFRWAREHLLSAKSELDSVTKESLPDRYRDSFDGALSRLTEALQSLEYILGFTAALEPITREYQANVLFVFQNAAEARPSGGFIGSYGLLKLKDGTPTSLLVESIYEIDGRLKESLVPPAPLGGIAGNRWAMRDSNWWPDFRVSAQNIERFYEWEGGQSVDLIVAVTPEVLRRVLAVTGEIELADYAVKVNAANFSEVVQYQTSYNYDLAENKPKKFLADLSRHVFEQIPQLPLQGKLEVFALLLESAAQKDLMFYSRHALVQERLRNLGLTGELADPESFERLDNLLITNANVSGGKTDLYIKQDVSLTTEIQANGQIKNSLTLSRVNNSPADMPLATNKNFLRIYVPAGSRLLESNYELYVSEELERTVFATTIELPPGSGAEIRLSYVLPAAFFSGSSYRFLLEKNPGQIINNFRHSIKLPLGSKIVHTTESLEKLADNNFSQSFGPVEYNDYLGVLYNR